MKFKLQFLSCILIVSATSGQVRMPVIFSDHMVVQRSQIIPVWGWSSPLEKIIIHFNKQTKQTKADRSGRWRINLDPENAGGPFILTVTGKTDIHIQDVMVGEVWVCSGQSNMEFNLSAARDGATEVRNSNNPEIRQIKVPNQISDTPNDDIGQSSWKVCSTTTAGNFTAVGYFFAREISSRLHVTVGLINSSWGGTMVETWISRGAFENSPEFKSMIASMPKTDLAATASQKQTALIQETKILQDKINDTVAEVYWKSPGYNSQRWPEIKLGQTWENQSMGLSDLDGVVWYRKEFTLDSVHAALPTTISLGTIDDADQTFINGVLVGTNDSYNTDRIYNIPPNALEIGRNIIAIRVDDTGGGGGLYGDTSKVYLKFPSGETTALANNWHFRIAKFYEHTLGFQPNDFPCLLYNAMIHPIIQYAIRGVLWYQGETNAGRAYQYRIAFPLLINDWRQKWKQGDFPFYFVQLASFNAANGDSEHGSTWAELREAQTMTLSLPNTGMAVTTDIGESEDIHPKNKQDVGRRLAVVALNNIYGKTMTDGGPIYKSFHIDSNKIIIQFSQTGSGLMVKDRYGYIRGFEIAGSNKQFHYAKALIRNNLVFVYADDVANPVAARYAWADDAGDANLFNKEGFPANSFRTDNWKGITEENKFTIEK
jgi:sialate O-acetylesterase